MFKLDVLKKPSFDQVFSREIKHEGVGLTLTVKGDEAFLAASEQVRQLQEREATLKATDRLKRGYVSAFEATIFMIGEYIIEKWNVEDCEGKAVPINGENLEVVINNINEPMQFVEKLLNEFNECASEFGRAANEIKKKPSTATSGKSKK